jgi:nucleoside-triphosphatase THEP1
LTLVTGLSCEVKKPAEQNNGGLFKSGVKWFVLFWAEQPGRQRFCELGRRARQSTDSTSPTFKPHSNHYSRNQPFEDPTELNWTAFETYYNHLNSSPYRIDRMRLRSILNFETALLTTAKHRTCFSDYRFRNTVNWTDQERKEIRDMFPDGGEGVKLSSTDDAEEMLRNYTSATRRHAAFFHQHCNSVRNKLSNELEFNKHLPTTRIDASTPASTRDDRTAESAFASIAPFEKSILRKTVQSRANDLKTEVIQEEEEETIKERTKNYDYGKMLAVAEKYIDKNCRSKGQKEVVTTFFKYFQEIGPYFHRGHHRLPQNVKPPHELLTGQPGAGKSTVIKMIMHVANLLQAGHIASTSFNGIAAVNVFGGTVCNLFNVNSNYDVGVWNQAVQAFHIKGETLKRLRQQLQWKSLQMLVIDEVSTIDTFTIAVIDARLRDVMEQPDKPFGGVAVLMSGDFDQLGPVAKTFIPHDMVEWNLHHMRYQQQSFDMSIYRRGTMIHRGCSLFSEFNRTHLTQQERSKDFYHNSNILRMSAGQPICTDEFDVYKDFKQPLSTDPESAQFPTFIVASNHERNDIIKLQAQRFAIKHKTYVIKWKNKVRYWKNKPAGKKLDEAYDDNSFMWQYFVIGASCFVKQNVNTALGIANGTGATMHSLCFKNDDQAQAFAAVVAGPSPPPYGSEIILEEPPLSVNVEVQFAKKESFLNHVQEEQERILKKHSLTSSETSAVIPITSTSGTGPAKTIKYFLLPRERETALAHAAVYPVFPLELGFAVTVHLAQGRTIPNVVVSISQPPSSQSVLRFKYSSLFVAMSRVQDSTSMQLLYKEQDREEALAYLRDLKPDKHTRLYNMGFVNDNGVWNKELSAAAAFAEANMDTQ